MKIAILTQPLNTNYGGILQCYALQTALQRMGHDVKVLTKRQYGYLYYIIYPFAVCKRIFKRYVMGKDVPILKAPHEVIRKKSDRFIKEYINQYKCRTFTANIAKEFDVVVVGSDQVWRPAYSTSIEEFFLSFLRNAKIKRIAYAASFGVDNCDEYSDKQINICSRLLKKFDAVSVREFSGIELCKKWFGVNAVQMIDPTLLLSLEDYRTLIANSKTNPLQGNMLVYILDKTDEKISLVENFTSDLGLNPFWFACLDESDENLPIEKRIKNSVEQWLRAFDDAEYIITDSFHGCIFSIIFRKQFWVIRNEGRGNARFESLLNLFSLNDRLICTGNKISYSIKNIDYDLVYKKLELKRKEFNDFMFNALL